MKVSKILTLLMCMFIAMPLSVNAEKKEKKEKKAYEWNWDKKLSGNETVDSYLLSVDSLWYQIKEVNELSANYQFKVDTLKVKDEYYTLAYMLDNEGNYITRGTVNWQFATVTLMSADIAAKGALAGVQSAAATASLPALGLKGISYAKYVKAGPKIVGMATTGIKNIWGISVAQAKRWNAMKKNAIKDPKSTGLTFTDAQMEKLNKCCYLTKIDITTPEGQAIKEIMEKKTEEQLSAEEALCLSNLETKSITQEDKSKIADDLDEDELNKFM